MFHRFPADQRRRNQWIVAIQAMSNQLSFIHADALICSAHFEQHMYAAKPDNKKILKNNAQPTVFCLDDVNGSYDNIEILSMDSVDETEISESAEQRPMDSGHGVYTDTEILSVDTQPTVSSMDDLHEHLVYTDEMNEDDEVDVPDSPPKKIRYAGDIKETGKKSRKQLEHELAFCKRKIKVQAAQMYSQKRKIKARNRQIRTLRALMNELKTKFALSQHATDLIENTFADDILEQLREGRKTKSYSENVRSFALTLNFYSNAAYQYVRRKFGNHLPSSSTITNWYKTVDGEPGISSDVLNILKRRVEKAKSEGKKVFLALMMDDISIRKQVIWNDNLKKYVGYVDFGTETATDENSDEATDALVFLVNAVNANWKLPLAYYFTNTFTGEEKAYIMNDILQYIIDTGAEVISLTFDGAPNNMTMAKCLGVDFSSPTLEKSYSFLFLFDKDDNQIKWHYIVELEKLQRDKRMKLHLGTKLIQQHIEYQNSKMKVKLATQTLSCS